MEYSRAMIRPADTTLDAWRRQVAIFRRMSGPERVAMAFEMSDSARDIAEAGIRHRHPEWDDGEVRGALVRRLLARHDARAVTSSHSVIA